MAITDWRPVTIPHTAPPSVQAAFQQLNINGRLLSECQQAAIANLTTSSDPSEVFSSSSTGTTPDVIGPYWRRGTHQSRPYYRYDSNTGGPYYLFYWGLSGGKYYWVISTALVAEGVPLPADCYKLEGTVPTVSPVGAYAGTGAWAGQTVNVYRSYLDARVAALEAGMNSILAALRTVGLIT